MTYENLLIYAEKKGLRIKEKELKYNLKGLYKDSRIIINSNIQTEAERKCILSEEIGHHETSYGCIIDESDVNNAKQELKARRWGYEKLIPLESLIQAYNSGARTKYEVACYLDVTETFLDEAVSHYRKKFGTCCEIDNYIIYFEPSIGILKKI